MSSDDKRLADFGDARLPDKFWRQVNQSVVEEGCWLWCGSRNPKGYGYYYHQGKTVSVHRLAYQSLVGPIPGTFPHGLTVDHLCRNRACVNPAHMELVTRGENTLRGDGPTAKHKAQTHCLRGHPFTEENTVTWVRGRTCKQCSLIRKREFAEKNPEAVAKWNRKHYMKRKGLTDVTN